MNDNNILKFEKINFTNRPIQVPYNYRIVYKISQIVLIIGKICKNCGCSIPKLNIITTALASNNSMNELEKYFSIKKDISSIVRFEPAVIRAINYGLAESLLKVQGNGKIKLSEKGKQLYSEIDSDVDVLVLEKQNLEQIKNKITDDDINEMIKEWSDKGAKNS